MKNPNQFFRSGVQIEDFKNGREFEEKWLGEAEVRKKRENVEYKKFKESLSEVLNNPKYRNIGKNTSASQLAKLVQLKLGGDFEVTPIKTIDTALDLYHGVDFLFQIISKKTNRSSQIKIDLSLNIQGKDHTRPSVDLYISDDEIIPNDDYLFKKVSYSEQFDADDPEMIKLDSMANHVKEIALFNIEGKKKEEKKAIQEDTRRNIHRTLRSKKRRIPAFS